MSRVSLVGGLGSVPPPITAVSLPQNLKIVPPSLLIMTKFFWVFFYLCMAKANLTSTTSLGMQTLLSYWNIKATTIEITKVGSITITVLSGSPSHKINVPRHESLPLAPQICPPALVPPYGRGQIPPCLSGLGKTLVSCRDYSHCRNRSASWGKLLKTFSLHSNSVNPQNMWHFESNTISYTRPKFP